ncbi:hypothetical protein LINPERHAP1_LOCUS9791 [Linum perenne]
MGQRRRLRQAVQGPVSKRGCPRIL